jgi:DNA modification methylase
MQLDNNRFHLIHGDCLDAMSMIPNDSVDLVLTRIVMPATGHGKN